MKMSPQSLVSMFYMTDLKVVTEMLKKVALKKRRRNWSVPHDLTQSNIPSSRQNDKDSAGGTNEFILDSFLIGSSWKGGFGQWHKYVTCKFNKDAAQRTRNCKSKTAD